MKRRRMWKRRKQSKWMSQLQPGSIIRARSGLERIVREFIAHPVNGKLLFVIVTINRCSWTKSGFTLLDADQLKRGGYRLVKNKKASLRTKMDKKIKLALAVNNKPLAGYRGRRKHIIDWWDIKGVA